MLDYQGTVIANLSKYMMKHSKPKPGETEKTEVILPYDEILAQEEAERMRMYQDLENGRITPIELKERNCIDWAGTYISVPWAKSPQLIK